MEKQTNMENQQRIYAIKQSGLNQRISEMGCYWMIWVCLKMEHELVEMNWILIRLMIYNPKLIVVQWQRNTEHFWWTYLKFHFYSRWRLIILDSWRIIPAAESPQFFWQSRLRIYHTPDILVIWIDMNYLEVKACGDMNSLKLSAKGLGNPNNLSAEHDQSCFHLL